MCVRLCGCSGYVVEKMNTKTGKWEPLTHSVGPDVNEFRVPKLKEGEDYKFRVRAENDQGQSEPLDSDKATRVKNPFGTCSLSLSLGLLKVLSHRIKSSQVKFIDNFAAKVTG